jgi:zinc transport system ATP-binding protein
VLRHGHVIHDGQPPSARPGHAGEDHEPVHPHTAEVPQPESGFAGLETATAALTNHPGTVVS